MSLSPSQPASPESIDLTLAQGAEVDPDLVRLERRPGILQLLMILVVMAFAGFVARIYRWDLAYYFTDDTPIEVGAIEELARGITSAHPANALAQSSEEGPDPLAGFGSNVYAHLSGVPQRRAVSSGKQYHQLVGAALFVEEDREEDDPLLRQFRRPQAVMEGRDDRTYLDAHGRLIHFSNLGRKYSGLIEFYQDGYNVHFCSEPLSRNQRQYLRQLREEMRPELQASLGPDFTEDQLDRMVLEAFPCQQGYLFQVGRAPDDHLGYVVLYGFLAMIEIGGLVAIIRWFRKMWASLRH